MNTTFINGLTSLQECRIDENGITQINLAPFNGLSSLNYLNLEENPIREINLRPLVNLTELKSLSFARCHYLTDLEIEYKLLQHLIDQGLQLKLVSGEEAPVSTIQAKDTQTESQCYCCVM